MSAGQDHEEGRLAVGVHFVQIQNAADSQALQAVRSQSFTGMAAHLQTASFELGGEKKTKGAALTFVRSTPCPRCYTLIFLCSKYHVGFVFCPSLQYDMTCIAHSMNPLHRTPPFGLLCRAAECVFRFAVYVGWPNFRPKHDRKDDAPTLIRPFRR